MAKNHFAIERPRRISISIQGYDAQAVTQAQQKKRLERAKRQNRKDAKAQPCVTAKALSPTVAAPHKPQAPEVNSTAKVIAQTHSDDDEIEALGKAAAGSARGTSDEELRNALLEGLNVNESAPCE